MQVICLYKMKYPGTITWFRLKKHAKVVEDHLNDDEEPIYTFAGQKNDDVLDIWSTCVVCLTNKRLIVAQDHIITGYTMSSVTPDMFNDLQVYSGIIFGKITIDTLKETIVLTNLDKKCLPEVEEQISSFMMEEKKKYGSMNRKK